MWYVAVRVRSHSYHTTISLLAELQNPQRPLLSCHKSDVLLRTFSYKSRIPHRLHGLHFPATWPKSSTNPAAATATVNPPCTSTPGPKLTRDPGTEYTNEDINNAATAALQLASEGRTLGQPPSAFPPIPNLKHTSNIPYRSRQIPPRLQRLRALLLRPRRKALPGIPHPVRPNVRRVGPRRRQGGYWIHCRGL